MKIQQGLRISSYLRAYMPVSIIMYVLFLVLAGVPAGCGGGSSGSSDYTPPQQNPGEAFYVLLSADRNVGQANAPLYMTALVTDINGRPVYDTTVTFLNTTGIGSVTMAPSIGRSDEEAVRETESPRANSTATVKTDAYGQAKIRLMSTSSGYTTVEAYAGGGLMERRTILFASSGTTTFNPLYFTLEVDGNNDGKYNEPDDLKVCQTTEDRTVKVKVSAYYKGEKATSAVWGGSNLYALLTSDVPLLVNFTSNIYVRPMNAGDTNRFCNYSFLDQTLANVSCGDVTTPSGSTGQQTISRITQDLVHIDASGEGFSDLTVDCATIGVNRTLNLLAQTPVGYTNAEFGTMTIQGAGGISLYLQPVNITGVSITANPTVVATAETSIIDVSVDTNLGPATAPDGTIVQLTLDCRDRTDGTLAYADSSTSYTFMTLVAFTKNGKVKALFTAPTIAPITNACTITAVVGTKSSAIDISIVLPLSALPATMTINPNTTTTAVFTLSGGTPPYTAQVDRSDLVSVSISGTTLTATVIKAPSSSTAVTITVRDAKHTEVTLTLTLDPTAGDADLTLTAPTQAFTAAMPVGQQLPITISGGIAPYTATTSSNLVSVAVSGKIVTVTLVSHPAGGVTNYAIITVTDSSGSSRTITFTVN